MANSHMKRCSTSLIIRQMQIKTNLRYHLIAIRMAILKKARNKYWRGYEKRELFVDMENIHDWLVGETWKLLHVIYF